MNWSAANSCDSFPKTTKQSKYCHRHQTKSYEQIEIAVEIFECQDRLHRSDSVHHFESWQTAITFITWVKYYATTGWK